MINTLLNDDKLRTAIENLRYPLPSDVNFEPKDAVISIKTMVPVTVVDSIMQLILADRTARDIESRIDENNKHLEGFKSAGETIGTDAVYKRIHPIFANRIAQLEAKKDK